MARLLLSKATLAKEKSSLSSYQRFLPALDMKRQQLRIAVKSAERSKRELTIELESLKRSVADHIPMLSNRRVELSQLVTVKQVNWQVKNIAGCRVPEVAQIEMVRAQPAALAKPHWFLPLQLLVEQALRLEIALSAADQQIERLSAALVKITQRVNLFDKVLIPKTEANIKRIQIYLGDREREAVVTSKIAKKRHAAGQLD
ncbi:V-type ATP synthase subunit D [Halioxenophilus sp. WMMB6]|uniref:V-type ATP synthase subunit D n=1 Tax=Halioxenophilus sp. WMMB6 TaxID=3073815 RepID=UPI00295EAB2B|nr:V-type ATP synthase subunit D [Halioxenophilus sp. WMMB6]